VFKELRVPITTATTELKKKEEEEERRRRRRRRRGGGGDKNTHTPEGISKRKNFFPIFFP